MSTICITISVCLSYLVLYCLFNTWNPVSNKIECSFIILNQANHDHYWLNSTKFNIFSLLKKTILSTEPRTQHLTNTSHIRGTHTVYTVPFFPGLITMHCKHLTWNHRSTPTSVCLLTTKKVLRNFNKNFEQSHLCCVNQITYLILH